MMDHSASPRRRIRWEHRAVRTVVLLGYSVLLAACGPREEPRLSSVVLITIDTLSGLHLGSYGYPRETSPFLDELAASGVRFHRAYTPISSTGPAHASLFTSLYPPSHGVVQNGMGLPDAIPVWAEYLEEAGFETAAFTNMYPFRKHGLYRGFDTAVGNADERADGIEGPIFAWADSTRADRFFLWIHVYSVHTPYWPPREYIDRFVDPNYSGKWWATKRAVEHIWNRKIELTDEEVAHFVNLYDSEVLFVDDKIRTIVGGLRRRGILDDAVLVLTADHGDLFSHGIYGIHEPSIYEGTLRIPLVFVFPDARHAGREVLRPVAEILDVMPTAFDLLHVPLPEGIQGRSLLPLIRGGNPGSADSLAFALRASNFVPHRVAAMSSDWKLIRTTEEEAELYDLKSDPGEQHNVAAEHPDRVADLEAQLDLWSEEVVLRAEPEEITDERTLEVLRALGYVD